MRYYLYPLILFALLGVVAYSEVIVGLSRIRTGCVKRTGCIKRTPCVRDLLYHEDWMCKEV